MIGEDVVGYMFKMMGLAIKFAWWFIKTLWFTGLICPLFTLPFWLKIEESGIDVALPLRIIIGISAFGLGGVLFLRNLQRWAKKHGLDSDIDNPKPADNLLSDFARGVVFGAHGRKWVCKPEHIDGHVLVVGGVGSGKSSCIAIPTLRAWNSRIFAIDIKGELYYQTAAYRKANVRVFNPLDDNSFGYNPYYVLDNSTNPAQEARAITQALIPLPPDVQDPFWIESAQSILTGAILHFHDAGLSFIATLSMIQEQSPTELIEAIYNSPVQQARYCVSSFIDSDEKLLSGIVLEISRNILPFITDNTLISCFSRQNNITPVDLEYGADIYIHIPEHLLRQWKGLLTLIVNQFMTFFEQREESNNNPILFLLDEFPRLGKVPAILDGLATLRSKKISMALIIQSLAQLDLIYGENARKVIADTCAYKAILSATDADTQDYFSRMVGTYDKQETSHGTNKEAFTGMPRGTSTNTQPQQRRIIKPEEFASLDDDMVLLTPKGYCRIDKKPYYRQS